MKVLRPLKAIRAKCMYCCAGQVKEIRECPIPECALWPYRMGKRPITENGSPTVEEQSLAIERPALSTE
ncbi:MAG: hypothetical protein VST67_13265 [Nitrospirota bacterium]|nr:hypothetical protein [Nitrospirota bacterium]